MRMQIVAYDRGPLNISETIMPESLTYENVQVRIAMLLRYKTEGGLLGAQFVIKYEKDETETVAEVGMMFSVYLEGWSEFAQSNPTNEAIVAYLRRDEQVFEKLIHAANAVVLERTKGTIVEKYFVPCQVDVDDFVANALRIVKDDE